MNFRPEYVGCSWQLVISSIAIARCLITFQNIQTLCDLETIHRSWLKTLVVIYIKIWYDSVLSAFINLFALISSLVEKNREEVNVKASFTASLLTMLRY